MVIERLKHAAYNYSGLYITVNKTRIEKIPEKNLSESWNNIHGCSRLNNVYLPCHPTNKLIGYL